MEYRIVTMMIKGKPSEVEGKVRHRTESAYRPETSAIILCMVFFTKSLLGLG